MLLEVSTEERREYWPILTGIREDLAYIILAPVMIGNLNINAGTTLPLKTIVNKLKSS